MALRNLFAILLLGCYLGQVLAFILPLQDDEEELSLGSQPGGDLRFSPSEMEAAKSGISNEKELWPGGVIPYKFDSSFDKLAGHPLFSKESAIKQVRIAMDALSAVTCITFREAKEDEFFLKIELNLKESACYTFPGRYKIEKGRESVKMVLATMPFCLGNPMAIVHEMIHSIGHNHEHQRPDRDEYITVYPENWAGPESEREANVGIPPNLKIFTPYDYKSIMHYRADRGAKPGTVLFEPNPKHYNGEYIEQLVYLTANDSKKVNALYKDLCPKK